MDSSTSNGHVYELTDVHRIFRAGGGEVRAVDGVDFVVGAGEFLVVEGPSGSGKTTLLQLLGALDRPSSGSVFFGGRDMSNLSDRELTRIRAREIGFVFQTFNLIPTLTALENVEIAMAPLGVPRAEKRARAEEVLTQLGLADRADHLPSILSGGEQQRVAIARAMANAPRVILADEPTGNLDSATADDIMSALADLCAHEGVTLIVVTHSEDVARRSARRLRMRDGRMTDDRTREVGATTAREPRSAWAPEASSAAETARYEPTRAQSIEPETRSFAETRPIVPAPVPPPPPVLPPVEIAPAKSEEPRETSSDAPPPEELSREDRPGEEPPRGEPSPDSGEAYG